MNDDADQSGDLKRAKIKNLISLYEKSGSVDKERNTHTSKNHQLATKISDFSWPEKEVSHEPKHAAEIAISDYVSVKNLISVYQQISIQGTSPVVGRRYSFTRKRKSEVVNDVPSAASNHESHVVPHSTIEIQKPSETKSQDSSPTTPMTTQNESGKPYNTLGLFDTSSFDEDNRSQSSKILTSPSHREEHSEVSESEEDSSVCNNGYTPLPESYIASRTPDGVLNLILPPAKGKSGLKKRTGKKKNVVFKELPTQVIETYNIYEYERGDDNLDPVASSAQYEIEKKTEKLDKFKVTLVKGGKGLGLSIVGIGLGSETGEERLGIYVKALTAGGVAETEGSLRVQDQILEVDGVSLVGVSQRFAGETLKATGNTVEFLIGREKAE